MRERRRLGTAVTFLLVAVMAATGCSSAGQDDTAAAEAASLKGDVATLKDEVSQLRRDLDDLKAALAGGAATTTTATAPVDAPFDNPDDEETTKIPFEELPEGWLDDWFLDGADRYPCLVVNSTMVEAAIPEPAEVQCWNRPDPDVADDFCAEMAAADEAKSQQRYGDALDAVDRAIAAAGDGDAAMWATLLKELMDSTSVEANVLEGGYNGLGYVEAVCERQWVSNPGQLGD